MMLRVRPAQLTTISVVGRGRDVVHAQHQFGARHVDAGRDRDARIFVVRPAVEHHHVGAGAHMRVELLGADRGRAARVLDEFAERLARHMDAGEQFEAGRGPGGGAAVEKAEIVIAGGGEHRGGACAEAVIVVDQHDAGIFTRHQAGEAQFQPAQRHVARPQQMAAREDQFLAHIDQRQFAAVAEHGFDGGGGEGAESVCVGMRSLAASCAGLVPGIHALGGRSVIRRRGWPGLQARRRRFAPIDPVMTACIVRTITMPAANVSAPPRRCSGRSGCG